MTSGLHLSKKGDSLLASNIIRALRGKTDHTASHLRHGGHRYKTGNKRSNSKERDARVVGFHATAGQTKVSDKVPNQVDAMKTAESTNPKHISKIPNVRGLKIGTFNILTLLKHIDELQIVKAHNKIDILAINETRLASTINDESIALNGYKVGRKDGNQFGGGVTLYILNSINTNLRPDLSAGNIRQNS